jgi:NADH:ubiquinone oxidoreductase subunit K
MRNAPPLGFLLVAAVLFVITIIGSNPNRRRSIIGLVICLLITVFAVYQHRLTQARVARDRAIRAQRAAFEAAMAAEQAATREYERLMDQAVSSEVKE